MSEKGEQVQKKKKKTGDSMVRSFLEELLATPSVSGHCSAAFDLLEIQLGKMGIDSHRSRRESLSAVIRGESRSGLLVCAHVDTLGALIRSIGADGTIRLKTVGGFTPNSVEGEYCAIETHDGRQYTGTLLFDRTSVHIYGTEKASCERKMEQMRLRLDEKASTAEEIEKLGISVGNYVHFEPRTVFTDNGYVKSRHLDDKAGVAAIIGMAGRLTTGRSGSLPRDIHLLFTGFEEVGHGGAVPIPDEVTDVVVVDVGVTGEDQRSREDSVTICAADSSGPFSYSLVKWIVGLAEESSIPFRIDTFQRYGSDAISLLRTGVDVRHALVGPAVDGSHALERTLLDGIEATADLLAAMAVSGEPAAD